MNPIKIPLYVLFLAIPPCLQAQAENCGCTILKQEHRVRIEGAKLTVTETVEMLVTDRRGEDFTSFYFPYTKGDKVSVDYAYIADQFGNVIRKLKSSEIVERQYIPESTLYHDEFIRYFSLRHNRYPYRVHCSVTHTRRNFMRLGLIAPEGRCNIENGLYSIEVPAGQAVRYISRNLAEPVKNSDGKTDKYTWEYAYTYVKPEINQSEESDPAPYMEALPDKFHFGVPGNYDSWESLGEWVWRLNDGLDALPESERARIDGLLEGVYGDREKARILYHYLQDYNRYVNVSVKLGGLKSYPAEYVCRNRFGDCKALCNYMRAILKYAGIEAYYTLAYSDENIPLFYGGFPNNSFNHILTVVPLQNDTLYLECTSKNLPFNYAGTSNQGRKSLITKSSGSRLIDIPAMMHEDVACSYRYTVECPDDRSSSIGLEARLMGGEFEKFSSFANEVNKNDLEQYLRHGLLGGSFVMESYDIEKPGRDSAFVAFRMKGSNAGSYRKIGSSAITLDPFSIHIPAYEPPEQRKTDVQLDLPLNVSVTAEYRFGDVEIARCPADIVLESPYGSYTLSFDRSPEGVTVTKTLKIDAGIILIDEYSGFHDFVSRVRNNESRRYHFEIL